MRLSRLPISKLLVFASCVSLLASEDASPPPETPKISKFAPADDLLRQLDFFLGRADDSLADPERFDLARQSRMSKDANTVVALALVLSMHDQEFPQKRSMPTLWRAAQRLAAGAEDYEQAVEALTEIKAARQGAVEPGESAKWEQTASLSALMKQVPLIHAGLKRGASRRRLARRAEQTSAQSAALAAIAQASMFDTEYAATADEVEAWQQYCAEMRDSAGEVNAAIHAQDSPRVDAGMKRLQQSCEACHAMFRQQIQ